MVPWGCPPPRGYLSVSSVPPEEHGIKGPFPQPPGCPLVGPAQPPVHLPHPTRGSASSPRGSGTVPQSRSQGRALSAPRAGSPRCPSACGADAAPRPPPPRPSAPAPLSARGGLAGAEFVGVGGGRPGRRQGRCCRGGGGGGGGGGCGAPASVGCRGGCTSPAARPAAGAPSSPPPSLRPALPPGLPCPVPSVPWGLRRPCPCPWAPFRPPARAAGPAPCPPRPGPPARPPSLAPLPARGRPARAPARPSRALIPSRPPARVAPSAVCALSPPAAAPLLPAAPALACSLRALLGTSPVSSCPPLRAPVAGTQLCLRAVPSFLDHAPGVALSLQLRQRDARRRALGRRGADVPRPPRGEGLGGERLGGTGVGVGGVGMGAVLRALPAHCCCCGGRRRGAPGPCGVFPPLSRRAGGRGVAGRGCGTACRGRGRNPSGALPALICGCGCPRRCARFLRRGYPPCRWRAGGRGRGRGVASWGCGLRFLRVWGLLPGRGGRACCLGDGGSHLSWLRLLGRRRRPDQHRRLRQRGSPQSTQRRRGSGSGTGSGGSLPARGSHRSLPSLLSW